MKYSGFKLGMKVRITVKDKKGEIHEEDGVITYSSGQRIIVKGDDTDYFWPFTRHGGCQVVPSYFEKVEMSLK